MKSPEILQKILWVFLIVSGIFATIGSPQGFMFTLLVAVYLGRIPLKKYLSSFSLPVAFMLAGTFSGILIEVFAIFSNAGLPPAEKVLLHPRPEIDLLIALFWYSLFTLTWYLFIRRIQFSKKTVYVLSATYGLFTEYGMLLLVLGSPLIGGLLALIVTAAYGIFPLIAYMLTEERFGERTPPKLKHYVYTVLALLLFWAVMGNFIYNPLIELFPKGF